METIAIQDIINSVFGLARDLVVYFAPFIGILAGLKFVFDWLHTMLFSRKV